VERAQDEKRGYPRRAYSVFGKQKATTKTAGAPVMAESTAKDIVDFCHRIAAIFRELDLKKQQETKNDGGGHNG